MKKFYEHIKALVLMLSFMVVTVTLVAQPFTSVQSGPADDPATWGGFLPYVFGGVNTAVGDITILSEHTIDFNGTTNQHYDGTLTIDGSLIVYGTLFITTFPPLGYQGNLVINGSLICSYLNSTNNVAGTGEIYSGGIGSTVVASTITTVTGLRIWTGADDDEWINPANWAPDIANPAPTGVVISPVADDQPEIDEVEATVSAFYMLNSDARLRIRTTGALTVEGVFSNQGGEVDIRSVNLGYGTITGSFIVEEYVGDGIVKIEQNIPTFDWHVISTPMDGLEMGAFAQNNNFEVWTTEQGGDGSFDFAPYNEADDEWGPFDVFPGTTTIMQPGIGYIARLTTPTEFDFEGNSIFTGTLNLTLDKTNFGWNAVGNPYTSGIRANALSIPSVLSVNAGSLSAEYTAVYMWDDEIGDYFIAGFAGSKVRIPVCQGFLVKANADGVPFQFTSGMQAHSNTTVIKSAEIPPSEIKLFVQAGDYRNSTRINFLEGSSAGFEKGYDVGKLKGNDNIALYSRIVDNSRKIDLGVQSLPDVSFSTLSIPIGLDLPAGGETVFSLETAGFPEGALVYLEDVELETKTQLNVEEGKYTVTLPEVYGADRFKLVVENYVSKNTTTNIDIERPEGPEYKVYTRDRNIIIEGESNQDTEFSLYNIEGRLFYEGHAKALNENEIDASTYPNGIYLLNISNSKKGETQTHKVAITK